MDWKEILSDAWELAHELGQRPEVGESVERIKTELEQIWLVIGKDVTRFATTKLAMLLAG